MPTTLHKKTKIVATVGPSLSTPQKILQAIHHGVNVFRINFSHGDVSEHAKMIAMIRQVGARVKRPVGILADLPGPKLRVGSFKKNEPVFLVRGKTITLTNRNVPGNTEEIPVDYAKLPGLVKKGDPILLNDGLMELEVLKSSAKDIVCKIVVGGELRQRKGINLPGKYIPISPFTEHDREILKVVSRLDIDFVALSFIQKPEDIIKARAWMKKHGRILPIVAKIEKPQAIKEIDAIIDETDAIMIARGDMGVEMPTSQVPVIQKQIIRLCAEKMTPVITATQMLDSMTFNPRPTRAETTDVANAIWDGTDAVMLSGETAMGKYPIQSIKMMRLIIQNAEEHPMFDVHFTFKKKKDHDASVIFRAAKVLSEYKHCKAIVVYTESGKTAVSLSKTRPSLPFFAITPIQPTYQRMSLTWGSRTLLCNKGKTVDELIAIGDKALIGNTFLKKGDKVVVIAGTGLSTGATNILKIHSIGE
ncbi:MAG: pyruvate kinase [Proteobacteria bacterium]|nr:pyruvate kinase [Pseudomonadota bacterium]